MRHLFHIALFVWLGSMIHVHAAAPATANPARREIVVTNDYLNLPVKNGGAKRWISLWIEGRQIHDFEIELAEGAPDWWAFVDVSAWRGKTMAIQADSTPAAFAGFQAIELSGAPKGTPMYQEELRPQFHFTSRRGWNNDPNGLVFYRGEYHLFYQHNPYGWNWGNMHWGHAVSRDLTHWKELGDALIPDALGTMFSGSAVVDGKNTAGFGREKQPAMVCFYTAAGDTSRQSAKVPFTQCLAYSTDGRTFAKYAANPILGNLTAGNRDPKVLWHEPSRKWIMTLYVETNKIHTIHFFGSTDLKHWTFLSQSDGFFECPDFFELPAAGSKKWVLTAASSEYQVGTFDGTRFQPETGKLPGHRGRGFYAAQTFSDMPDGRRIQIGWLQAPSPGMPFNQAMTVPLELNLKTTAEGSRLSWKPVKELRKLRGRYHRLEARSLQPGDPNPAAAVATALVELNAEFRPDTAGVTVFNVHGARIAYDAGRQELSVNDLRVPAPLMNGRQQLQVLADRTVLEIFASEGLVYVPFPFIPRPGDNRIEVATEKNAARFDRLEVYELKSAW